MTTKTCRAFWTGGECTRDADRGDLCAGHSSQYYRDVAFSELRKYESKEAANWKERYAVILDQRNKLIEENKKWQDMYEDADKNSDFWKEHYDAQGESRDFWKGESDKEEKKYNDLLVEWNQLASDYNKLLEYHTYLSKNYNKLWIEQESSTLEDPIDVIEIVYGNYDTTDWRTFNKDSTND